MHFTSAFTPPILPLPSPSILALRKSSLFSPQAALTGCSSSFQKPDSSSYRCYPLSYPLRQSALPSTPRPIHLLASDLDGTLLNSSKCVDAANVEAIISLVQSGITFVPATGKSHGGALRAMGKLGSFLQQCGGREGKCPGIFLNGSLIYGKDGEMVYEKGLETHEAITVLTEAEKRGLVVLIYVGDQILVRERGKETDMFIVSHESVPEAVSDLEQVIREMFIHKVLLVDPRGKVTEWRAELEKCLEGVGCITQARSDALEVLPMGSGKGDGFRRLLQHLGMERKFVMAIGDGENDLQMIQEAGLGVAVANAVPELLLAADEVVCRNEKAAVAYAIHKFVSRVS